MVDTSRLPTPERAISERQPAPGVRMGTFSTWHLLGLLVWIVVFIVPAWRIVMKAGFNGALSLLMLIPLVNIIMIWVFAFVRWPVDQRAS
jgi:hypothetical protein